jgi:hypothetical protein
MRSDVLDLDELEERVFGEHHHILGMNANKNNREGFRPPVKKFETIRTSPKGRVGEMVK